jgi:hypothetical protein
MMKRSRKLFKRLLKHLVPSRGRALPLPLPRHPTRGIRVEKGDTFTITNLSISVEDAGDIERADQRTFPTRVPPWSHEYDCGASFALRRRLDEGTYRIDKHRLDIVDDGWTLEVALTQRTAEPLRVAYLVADRTLDLLAAEGYRISELNDPLREHGVWFRTGSKTVLRNVTTARLAVRMRSAAVVRDPSGVARPSTPRPPTRWHPSHAYFRRSQSTNDLHEAYRNLFLALEALLSEVYPWSLGLRETTWLKNALEYVVEGYGLDLSQFVGRSGGNPSRRFVKEQYRARRCALFHAKLSEGPALPGDIGTRDELAAATRRLGQLYVQLARLITGAGFAGGGMTYVAFESMVKGLAGSPLYVSEQAEFDASNCIQGSATFSPVANSEGGLYELKCTWPTAQLPPFLRRAGSIIHKEGHLLEGMCASLHTDMAGADEFQFVVQHELTNADQLREWLI